VADLLCRLGLDVDEDEEPTAETKTEQPAASEGVSTSAMEEID